MNPDEFLSRAAAHIARLIVGEAAPSSNPPQPGSPDWGSPEAWVERNGIVEHFLSPQRSGEVDWTHEIAVSNAAHLLPEVQRRRSAERRRSVQGVVDSLRQRITAEEVYGHAQSLDLRKSLAYWESELMKVEAA